MKENVIIWCAKRIFISLLLIVGLHLNAKEKETDDYLIYVDQIIESFVQEMKKNYGLQCYGSGGRMPNDVEEIDVMFIAHRKVTLEEARIMEVNAIQKLLSKINTHEKIRPFLREYPFKTDRVNVSLSFHTKDDQYHLDGSVVYVFLAKNKIFYRAAEIVIQEPTPLTRVNEKNEIITEYIGGGPSEELIPLVEESFEEAAKLVRSEKKS